MAPSKSCGLCVSLTEKHLVAREPTEEMFYLKELHSRSCLPPVAQGQGIRAGPPQHPGLVGTDLGRLHREAEIPQGRFAGRRWIQNVQCARQSQELCQNTGELQVVAQSLCAASAACAGGS